MGLSAIYIGLHRRRARLLSTGFFTFYGLTLLKKDLSDLKVSTLGNPAMPMPTPNFMQMILGMESMATMMMKQKIADKGVASIDELRSTCIEGGVMGV